MAVHVILIHANTLQQMMQIAWATRMTTPLRHRCPFLHYCTFVIAVWFSLRMPRLSDQCSTMPSTKKALEEDKPPGSEKRGPRHWCCHFCKIGTDEDSSSCPMAHWYGVRHYEMCCQMGAREELLNWVARRPPREGECETIPWV